MAARKTFDLAEDRLFGSADALDTEERVHALLRDAIAIDPRQVARQGPYVRNWNDPAELDAFCESVAAEGRVLVPIGIREVGGGYDVSYVLVYGDRRLTAALRAGFDEVPAINHGAISEAEALLLQTLENEPRKDMHLVDVALAYHALTEAGYRQADICRRFGVDSGYMSVMVRAGGGIARLSAEERHLFYTSSQGSYATFQRVVRGQGREDSDAVASALRAVLAERPKPRLGGDGPFRARDVRGGRRFSFRWTPSALERDPAGTSRALTDGLRAEVERLREHLEAQEGEAAHEARQQLQRVLAALNPASPAP